MAAFFNTAKTLILQKPSHFLLRPVEGSADGAFVDAPVTGDLGQGLVLEVVGLDGVALEVGQLLLEHLLHPLHLKLPGDVAEPAGATWYIFHCGSTPGRSSGR